MTLLSRALLLSTLLAAGACDGEAAPPPPAPAVLTAVVHATPEAPLERRGTVAPGARLRLGFNAAGVIADVRVKMGDVVHKGDLVARLRDSGGGAMLAAAEAQRSKALRDRQRAETLVARGTFAQAQGDDALSSLRVANANASIAASALAQRQIFAPISGTVLERLAEPGESVIPGAPVVVLDDTERLLVKVGVTERERARVAANQPVTITGDGVDGSIAASVMSVAPAPREDGLYTVEIEPPAPVTGRPKALAPGSMVTVQFGEQAKQLSMHVPLEALVDRGGKTWAFVVASSVRGALTTVKMRELDVDRAEDRQVLVRSGLRDGDRIVREGAYFLNADETVRLLD